MKLYFIGKFTISKAKILDKTTKLFKNICWLTVSPTSDLFFRENSCWAKGTLSRKSHDPAKPGVGLG